MSELLNISFIDVLDILLVGLLIYEFFRLIKGTAAMSAFMSILILYGVWIIVQALDMKLLSNILGQVLGVGVIALIIIFQQEIRNFLMHFSTKYVAHNKLLMSLSKHMKEKKSAVISAETIDEIVTACANMSATKTGALMVFKHVSSLSNIIETGDTINANIHRRLIENIFFKNSPLHDGAMILSPSKIIAARCTLPITDQSDINPRYGMRHRAALGVSEATDATVVVVSEETGDISFVERGTIRTVGSASELKTLLENSYR